MGETLTWKEIMFVIVKVIWKEIMFVIVKVINE